MLETLEHRLHASLLLGLVRAGGVGGGNRGGFGAAFGRHHLLELLEPDASVAVDVDAGDHPLALLGAAPLPDLREHPAELGGGDAAVPVDVVDVEGGAELGLELAVVPAGAGARVERRELAQVHVAVAVRVELVHHGRHLPAPVRRGRRRGDGAVDRGELRGGDPAVPVRVEAGEHLLHLRGHRRGPLALGRRRRRRRLGLLLGASVRHGHGDEKA
ncbi:hypothetical protein SEVIR_5G090450v4 [Setaria viridis]